MIGLRIMKNNYKTLIVSSLLVMLLLLGCSDKSKLESTQVQNSEHYNICVLLDLSDRINPEYHSYQITKDKKIIERILSIFKKKVREKYIQGSRDKLQIAIAYQPVDYDATLQEAGDKFIVDMDKLMPIQKRETFDDMTATITSAIDTVYSVATHSKKFVGADIWGFFMNELDNYTAQLDSENIRNILIILTDGYIQFDNAVLDYRPPGEGNRTTYMLVKMFLDDPDWETKFDNEDDHGLISGDKDHRNWEVMVLEINPKSGPNTTEHKIIEKYWMKWLGEMNIKHRSFLTSSLTTKKIEGIIEGFLAFRPSKLEEVIITILPPKSDSMDSDLKFESELNKNLKKKIQNIINQYMVSTDAESTALDVLNQHINEKIALYNLIIHYDPTKDDADLESIANKWRLSLLPNEFSSHPAKPFVDEVARKVLERHKWSQIVEK